MSETRHRTVIEFDVQADGARRTIAELAQAAENLQKVFGGAGQGNAGGASATGAGHAPAAAMGGSGTSPAGASAHAPAAPPGAVAPSAAPGTGHAPIAGGGGGGFGGGGGGGGRVGPNGGTWDPAAWQAQQWHDNVSNMKAKEFQRVQANEDLWNQNKARIDNIEAAKLSQRATTYGGVAVGVGQLGSAYFDYQRASMGASYSAINDTSAGAPFNFFSARSAASADFTRSATGGIGSMAGMAIGGLMGGVMGAMLGGSVGNTLAGALGGLLGQGDDEQSKKDAAMAASIGSYAQLLQRRGNLDQANNMNAMFGGRASLKGASRYGMTPEEGVAAYGAFGQAAGISNAFNGQDVYGISRSTASLGAAGAYVGLTGAGAGGFTADGKPADVSGMIGLAQSQGLRGGKIDQYLGAIVSAVQSMATKGLALDLTATQGFLQQLNAPGSAAANMGQQQTRAVSGLMGTRQSARDQLLAPFAEYQQQAYFADIMGHAKSPMDALRLIEGDTSPQAILRRQRAQSRGMSKEDQALAYASAYGVDTNMAGALGSMDLEGMGTRTGMTSAKASGIRRAFAETDAYMLDEAKGKVGDAEKIAQALFDMQKVQTRNAQAGIAKLTELLNVMQRLVPGGGP